MHRMVIQVFKAIAFAMIFVFVFDMAFYLYRVYVLNQRMESINVSLQKVVSENNYLPEAQYKMFNAIYNNMARAFNGGSGKGDDYSDYDHSGDDFVVYKDGNNAVKLNYGQNNALSSSDIANKFNISDATFIRDYLEGNMALPADYGDVMIVNAEIAVNQPLWGFVRSGKMDADSWQKVSKRDKDRLRDSNKISGDGTVTFTYTYFVPCLKYQSVTE